MTESNIGDIDKKLQDAYAKAEQVALISVLKLIYETTKIDLYKDFKLEHPLSSTKSKSIRSGELILTDSHDNKCKVFLDIVDKDFDLMTTILDSKIKNVNEQPIEKFNDINEVSKKQIIGIISYLTQSCLLVFNNLKNNYKELLEFNIILDENTTIYLDFESKKRIGIIFKDFAE